MLSVDHRSRWEIFAGAALVVVATVAVAGWSFFDRDDLVFAEYFQLNPLTSDVFFRSWFGHLMPGYIASVWAFLEVFGLSWPAAVLFISAIHAGAFVALTRCLDAVVGATRLNVIAALAFSLSLGPMMLRLWWAATLNNMFALALGLAVLGCATRWLVTGRARHLLAALSLYALALAMSEKNLLFSLHIAAWCLLVVWRGLPLGQRLRNAVRAWPLWAGLVVLSLVDVIAFLTGGFVDESGDSPSVMSTVSFVTHNILGGLVPSLFGIDMADETTNLLDPRVVITVLLLAAFIVWSLAASRLNRGVWAFALIAVLANAAVLSRRGEMIGDAGSRQLRYLLESSALLWLALGVVLVLSLRARRGMTSVAGGRHSVRAVTLFGLTSATLLGVAASLSWALTLVGAVERSGGYQARGWVSALRDTLPDPTPPLIDSPLPLSFGMPTLHPYDMVGALLPSLGWNDVRTTTVLEGAWVVGPDGDAGPAELSDPDVQFAGERCTDGSFNVPMPEIRTAGRTYLVLDFTQGSGDSMTFFVADGWTTIDRPEGAGTVVAYMADPIDGDLEVGSQGGNMCISALTVADVVPGGVPSTRR